MRRRIIVLYGIVAVVALWMRWWASVGFPLSHEICGIGESQRDCSSYNVFFYSAWTLGKAVDHWSALITAIFTVVLGVSTIYLWKVTAKSAQIAERALTELEAPIVGVKIVRPGLEWDPLKTNLSIGNLQFSFVNYGRTPAMLHELIEDVRSAKIGEGFPPGMKGERGPPMPYGVFVPPSGETRPFNFNIFAFMLGTAVNDPTQLKNVVPFFMGTAKYGDIFGNLYTMGFCFIFDDMSNRFIEAGDTEYSYCRKERGKYIPPGGLPDFTMAAG